MQPWQSPGGKFASVSRNISEALGRVPHSDSKRQSHPFDLELCTVPPGKANCPYHTHSVQTEMYVILAGHGQVRTAGGLAPIAPQDVLLYPPGEAHQIINDGAEDLVFYCIADDPPSDACYYPDSAKWALPRELHDGPIVKGEAVDYFLGEE